MTKHRVKMFRVTSSVKTLENYINEWLTKLDKESTVICINYNIISEQDQHRPNLNITIYTAMIEYIINN